MNKQIKYFELRSLKKIHQQLIESSLYLSDQQNILVLGIKIKQLCEMIIWGQKNNPDFFDYFCQFKCFQLIFKIFVGAKYKSLVVDIINAVSLLIVNISKPEDLNYLLSHETMMHFQLVKFSTTDVEIAEYYINFLKSLCLKINQNTINLFYNEKYPLFALAYQTARFYNHTQPLVRTTSRNILLTLVKMKYHFLPNYFSSFPFVIYYSHFCCMMRQGWIRLNKMIEIQSFSKTKVKEIIDQNFDLLSYLDEFLKSGTQESSECFINAFIEDCMKVLLKSLTSIDQQIISIKISLFIISQIFKIVSNTNLINILLLVLFGRYTHADIYNIFQRPPNKLISYSNQWRFKNFWDSYDYQMQALSRTKFLNKQAKQVTQILQTGKNMVQFDQQLNKINNLHGFGTNSHQILINVYKDVSRQISLKIALNLQLFTENTAKTVLFEFLTSKDDSLVMLSSEILINILENQSIPTHILEFCGLCNRSKTQERYNRITFQKILRSALKVLIVDPPTFRLCTIQNMVTLILLIVKQYDNIDEIVYPDMKQQIKLSLEIACNRLLKLLNLANINIYQQIKCKDIMMRQRPYEAFGLFIEDQNINLQHKLNIEQLNQIVYRDFCGFFLVRNLYSSLFKTEFEGKDQKLNQNQKYQVYTLTAQRVSESKNKIKHCQSFYSMKITSRYNNQMMSLCRESLFSNTNLQIYISNQIQCCNYPKILMNRLKFNTIQNIISKMY